MARRQRRNNRRMNVLQVRQDGDTGAARIDRLISSQRYNESAVMVTCKTAFPLAPSTTTSVSVDWSFPQIAGTDDFQSMAQQFNTFKVKAIKFEVFNTNATASSLAVFSTCHSDFVGQLPSTWTTLAGVVDAPDAKYVTPGSPKQELFWNARGTAENSFQDVNSYANYGGFRAYLDAGSSTTNVATVIATACVVFRGRH